MANAASAPLLDDDAMRSAGDSDQVSPRSSSGRSASAARASFIIKVSLYVALAWWGFGFFTVVTTHSLAVLASLVDATIDLAAQGVLLFVNMVAGSGGKGSAYPVGVSRLEPVGVMICAVLMAIASGGVMTEAVNTLVRYYPKGPQMEFTDSASAMLACVVVVKVLVWRFAKAEYDKTQNVSLEALVLDNFNDILSNGSALLFASLTRIRGELWWVDPVGGILISIYIIRAWFLTAFEQVNMLVGKEAHPEFLDKVKEMAEAHHPEAKLDIVRAYHFGPRFLVEVELVMDRNTPLETSHDVGMLLQDSIERMDECERCFVHIDYEHRAEDDHDRSVPITMKTTSPPARLRLPMLSGQNLV